MSTIKFDFKNDRFAELFFSLKPEASLILSASNIALLHVSESITFLSKKYPFYCKLHMLFKDFEIMVGYINLKRIKYFKNRVIKNSLEFLEYKNNALFFRYS